MAWDFETRPELPNSQMQIYYFTSPHKQITEDFTGLVVKVIDGDTVRLRTAFRDFDFPLRMLDIDAKELNEGGQEAKLWLQNQIEGKEVDIIMNRRNRVGKFGRLLGKIRSGGLDMGDALIRLDLASPFGRRGEGEIPNINRSLDINKWF